MMLDRLEDLLGSAAARYAALGLAVMIAVHGVGRDAAGAFRTAFGAGFALLLVWFAPQLAEYRGFQSFRFVDSSSPPVLLRLLGWILLILMAVLSGTG